MSDVRSQFGRVAREYLTSKAHDRPDELQALVALVSPQGGRVLDVGTGAGHTAYAFAPHVDEVVATDVTPEMLDLVREESQKRGLSNIAVEYAEAEKLPYADSSFDGVTCRVAAHHFLDVRAFVSEVYRVLRDPGWFLLVDTISPADAEAAKEINEIETVRDPSHVRNYSVAEWIAMLVGAGFTIDWIEESEKRLDLGEWTRRMRVPEDVVPGLVERIQSSEGAVGEYLDPAPGEFSLRQLSAIAWKRSRAV